MSIKDDRDRLFESPPSRMWIIDYTATVNDGQGWRSAPGVAFVDSTTFFGACQFMLERWRYPVRITGGGHPIDANELDVYSARRL